jgi:anaerobic selenocysteine-containing dehydrogenase
MIHPDALATAGIADGDRVRIGNDRGSVIVDCSRLRWHAKKRVVIVEG